MAIVYVRIHQTPVGPHAQAIRSTQKKFGVNCTWVFDHPRSKMVRLETAGTLGYKWKVSINGAVDSLQELGYILEILLPEELHPELELLYGT